MKEASSLVEADVSQEVSQMIADLLDVDVKRVRDCASFVELHPDFDSLAVLEIQNLAEERFGVPLALDADHDTFPMCLQELVALIMRCAAGQPSTASTQPGGAS